MTVLDNLAEFCTGNRHADLGEADKERLAIHALDTVGAMIVGATTADGEALSGLLAGGADLDDVAVRCGATRLTEIDDIHLPSGTTPGSMILPAAFTLGARLGASAAEVADAVCNGYELITRLGEAIDGPNVLYRGTWPTYFCAPFGTAAVAARLLGLSPGETAHALAIALSLSTGGAGRAGPALSSRWLVAGHAARSGCLAAVAASRGYKGDLTLLDGDWAAATHGLALRAARLSEGIGEHSAVAALSIKPYCSAKQAIAAIFAFRDVLARGVAPADIGAVRVAVPDRYRAMIDHGVIEGNRMSSISSAPYQLALAACRPDGLSDVKRSVFVQDRDFLALMDKVTVSADDSLAEHFPASWPARVEVETAAGTETALVVDAPGDPARRFDRDQAAQKFHRFVDPIVGGEAAGGWIGLCAGVLTDDDAFKALATRLDETFARPAAGPAR